jgi:hypothetical protein
MDKFSLIDDECGCQSIIFTKTKDKDNPISIDSGCSHNKSGTFHASRGEIMALLEALKDMIQ